MSRIAQEMQGSIVRVALALFFTLLMSGGSGARDIVDGLEGDAENMDVAVSNSVAEVREAIEDCLRGNFNRGIPVLEHYSGQQDVWATYVLAEFHVGGTGVEQSKEKAIELLNRNIKAGHGQSMVRLGMIKEDISPAEALQLYKQASAMDNGAAHLKLGSIFEDGLLGVTADLKLAFEFYEKAHLKKHVLGTFHTARCYDTGVGVSPNATESTRLYRQAAMAGAGHANTVMARRYFEGKGVEADPVAAVGWLVRGAQAGSSPAMVLLGQRYEIGDVLGKDLGRAGQLYSEAAKLDDPVGSYHLAMMYLNGIGTQADPVRAYVLLEGATTFPQAKIQFEKLEGELTAEQLSRARQKISEATAAKQE